MAAWMSVAGPRMKSALGFLYEGATIKELRPK
jgi:hypothetical protein